MGRLVQAGEAVLDAGAVAGDVLLGLLVPSASHAAMIGSQPSRIALVEKLVWAPAPFQSPLIGLGSMRDA